MSDASPEFALAQPAEPARPVRARKFPVRAFRVAVMPEPLAGKMAD
jgi:hypothetical protein